MRRRQFVTTASATIASASIAGCSGILGGGGGGGSSGPAAAVEGYFEAGQSGDTEGMREYVHPEGELTGVTATGGSENAEVSLESTEVVEQNDGRATVTAEVEISSDSGSMTLNYEFDVRKHEGEWKIYSMSGGMSGSN